jgi:hypothetical protein
MARPRIKPEFTEKDLGKHPLLDSNFVINYKALSVSKKYVELESIKSSDGIVEIGNVVKNEVSFTVDADSFTKVFNKSAYRIHMMSLSSRAKELCFWLIYELDCGKDYIWLNKKRYMTECNVSLNTMLAAIKDLVRDVILIPSAVKDVYWINPLFFFNGSRLEKYKEYAVKV